MDDALALYFAMLAIAGLGWIGAHWAKRRREAREVAAYAAAQIDESDTGDFPKPSIAQFAPDDAPEPFTPHELPPEMPAPRSDGKVRLAARRTPAGIGSNSKAIDSGVGEFSLRSLDRLGNRPRPPLPHHALSAAEHANVDLIESAGLVADVGLLVYTSGAEKPEVYREAPIPDTADYIQPFAELWFDGPYEGEVRFRLIDDLTDEPYAIGVPFSSAGGRLTVLAPTRLPVGDHLEISSGEEWSLWVSIDGVRLADHRFRWFDPDSADALTEHLAEDGELTVDLAALVEQVRLTDMSLDELLAGDASAAARGEGRHS